jgi:hypothetical protein
VKHLKLFEDADNAGGYYDTPNTYPFGYYNSDFLVGQEGLRHDEMKINDDGKPDFDRTGKVDKDKDYSDMTPAEVDKNNKFRRDLKFAGRIWLNEKKISFWDYPSKHKFKEIIDKLEEILSDSVFNNYQKIWNNGFKVELIDIIDGDPNEEYTYENGEIYLSNNEDYEEGYRSIYIPIEEYDGEVFKIKGLNKIKHVESPLTKKKKFIKGFGSDSTKGRQDLKFKQALLKSESILFEDADFAGGGGYSDGNTYPFGYYNDEFYIGSEAKTHGSMDIELSKEDLDSGEVLRVLMKYPGRIWIEKKTISFWEYPSKNGFKELIKELEEKLETKIWNNGFKVELIEIIDYDPNEEYEYDPLEIGSINGVGYDGVHNSEEKVKTKFIFIPIEEYEGEMFKIKGINTKQHIESPLTKQMKFIKGFGSDSPKGKQPLKFKQALLKSEGVGDVYAEKKFKIPNYSDFERGYRYHQLIKNKEELIDGGDNILVKNPKDINAIDEWVRGVIDKDGNLFIEKEYNTTHTFILNILIKKGYIDDNFNRWWDDDEPTEFVCVMREKHTNKLLLSESYSKDFIEDYKYNFIEFTNKCKSKNPEWRFILESIKTAY